MVIFSTFFFRQYRPGKCLFRYSRTKKIFLGYENNKLKNLKNWFFSKGVNPWFWSKKGYFSLFFRQHKPRKCFYNILERTNAFLCYKNNNFRKSKNWLFFKRVNPWFWSKNGHFLNFFFRHKSQKNDFYNKLERKNAFLGYKSNKFQKSKNWHFFQRG